MLQRLARPGVRVRHVWLGVVMPVALVWAMALVAWFHAPADTRMPLLMGQTWRTCIESIGLMALPVFVAALFALRTLAPTHPAKAGAAAGALAGGAGAIVYALHCPETHGAVSGGLVCGRDGVARDRRGACRAAIAALVISEGCRPCGD